MKKRKMLFFCAMLWGGMVSGQNFPRPTGYVNDFADIISAGVEQEMTSLAVELERKTGVEIAVATVPDMGGDVIDSYANRLYESWGIGKAGKDNGVLILLALEERKVKIETGYGLEPILPDGKTGGILDEYVIPDLRRGDYGRGLYRGMAAVAGVIAEDAGIEMTGIPAMTGRGGTSREEGRFGGGLFILLMIFLIIITRGRILPWLLIGSMMGGGRGGGFGGGGFSGGFGGFGGGMSGGGGASRGF